MVAESRMVATVSPALTSSPTSTSMEYTWPDTGAVMFRSSRLSMVFW